MRRRLQEVRELTGQQWRALILKALALVAIWLLVTIPAAVLVFVNSSTQTVIASHDAVVSPSLDGYATLDLGPYLPNVRYPTGSRVGAQIDLGKTTVSTYEALVERYAVIGAQPEGQVAKLRATLGDLATGALVRGAIVGLALPALWFVLGARRRAEMLRHLSANRVGFGALAGVLVAVAVIQPWQRSDEPVKEKDLWLPVTDALSGVPIPEEAAALEIQTGLITSGTERLLSSAFDTYNRSVAFYEEVEQDAQLLSAQLRQPAEDETVVLLVSDRHDNVGMDPVARTIADEGGATAIFDAGDDTSTGEPWEAFSLDSLHEAFGDLEHKFSVAGNHDNGDFVSEYLGDRGWTTLQGEVVDGPDGIRMLGANDPRSSGLGTWRDETGVSFDEQRELIADEACASDEDGERIATLLVHDANSGREALERGCVDLVLGGHIHAQLGPTLVPGENGKAGYTYTNGTTGGAAYALAIGSKLRRDAQVTLVTYQEGVPVGIQPVTVRTVGDFEVGEYVELQLDREADPTPSPPTPDGPSPETSPEAS